MQKSSGSLSTPSYLDKESEACLTDVGQADQVLAKRFPDVRVIMVVLSSKGMVYDFEALRQKIGLAYSGAALFFQNTQGKPIGPKPPSRVDLLIDFTGPGQRQGWLYARKLRRMAKYAVGRNAGFFRKGSYDRIFDERQLESKLPQEALKRERVVQKNVLQLAGVPFAQVGEVPPDLGKSIALDLPSMQRL